MRKVLKNIKLFILFYPTRTKTKQENSTKSRDRKKFYLLLTYFLYYDCELCDIKILDEIGLRSAHEIFIIIMISVIKTVIYDLHKSKQHYQAIVNWKRHILREKQQRKAKTRVMKNLLQAILVRDWAKKILPGSGLEAMDVSFYFILYTI